MNKDLNINDIVNIVKTVSNNSLMPLLEKANITRKQDGSLVTEADLAVQTAIKHELEQHYDGYGFFAEEMTEQEMISFFAKNQQGYWCLDPLDGTSNFASALPFFAISLALIVNGQTQMAVVYDPVRQECFHAVRGEGAYFNGQLIQRHSEVNSELQHCIAMIDFKRLPQELSIRLVSEHKFASLRSFGAAALEWCWLALGRCQVYLHGKHMLWDYAAGLLIAEEAGCYCSTLSGESVFRPSMESRKVVAAVNETLYHNWFNYISN